MILHYHLKNYSYNRYSLIINTYKRPSIYQSTTFVVDEDHLVTVSRPKGLAWVNTHPTTNEDSRHPSDFYLNGHRYLSFFLQTPKIVRTWSHYIDETRRN